MDRPEAILAILDATCGASSFPAFDNGYVYPAAARLSLFRSSSDWALVIEDFGYMTRAAEPQLTITTCASTLHGRKTNFVNDEALARYLASHPHDEHTGCAPLAFSVDDGGDFVADDASTYELRGRDYRLPSRRAYAAHGIALADDSGVHAFELCRYVAAIERDAVLASVDERRANVLPAMQQILCLDEWRHPDVCGGERPSGVETFRQLAHVLATGDVSAYRPRDVANTHWSNWPEGGTL